MTFSSCLMLLLSVCGAVYRAHQHRGALYIARLGSKRPEQREFVPLAIYTI